MQKMFVGRTRSTWNKFVAWKDIPKKKMQMHLNPSPSNDLPDLFRSESFSQEQ
jgi:hypothetical protein